jgi:hypothetical protein
MSENGTQALLCERCGRDLTASDPAPMCAQCAVEVADGRASESRASEPEPTAGRGGGTIAAMRRFGPPVLAILLAVILVARVPALVGAFAGPVTAHDGTITLDATGDRCLANLWTISSSMSEREPIDIALACPASGRPYVTTEEAGVTVVSCPNPASHGASAVSIRSDALVPRVR